MDHSDQNRNIELPQIIPPHGGYRDLKSYQISEIVHDATVVFCDRFINRRSRTHDQMVQAARSGKQNIAEGSTACPSGAKTTRRRGRSEPSATSRIGLIRLIRPNFEPPASAEVGANAAICLIHQANYLLDQQLRALDKEFLEEGGFTEKLYRARTQRRDWKRQT